MNGNDFTHYGNIFQILVHRLLKVENIIETAHLIKLILLQKTEAKKSQVTVR